MALQDRITFHQNADKKSAISFFIINSLYELLKQWHQYANFKDSPMSKESVEILKSDTEKIMRMYLDSLRG